MDALKAALEAGTGAAKVGAAVQADDPGLNGLESTTPVFQKFVCCEKDITTVCSFQLEAPHLLLYQSALACCTPPPYANESAAKMVWELARNDLPAGLCNTPTDWSPTRVNHNHIVYQYRPCTQCRCIVTSAIYTFSYTLSTKLIQLLNTVDQSEPAAEEPYLQMQEALAGDGVVVTRCRLTSG